MPERARQAGSRTLRAQVGLIGPGGARRGHPGLVLAPVTSGAVINVDQQFVLIRHQAHTRRETPKEHTLRGVHRNEINGQIHKGTMGDITLVHVAGPEVGGVPRRTQRGNATRGAEIPGHTHAPPVDGHQVGPTIHGPRVLGQHKQEQNMQHPSHRSY